MRLIDWLLRRRVRRTGYRDPVFGWVPFRRPDLPVPLDGPRPAPTNPFKANQNQNEGANHV